jgi:hypothetical protein
MQLHGWEAAKINNSAKQLEREAVKGKNRVTGLGREAAEA